MTNVVENVALKVAATLYTWPMIPAYSGISTLTNEVLQHFFKFDTF